MKMENLKVLTLNCWGVPVPIICKKRSQRIAAIAEALSKVDYHIIVLLEVWLKSDYKIICEKVSQVMPFKHYFYSGVIGSGISVFSKLPILETFFHRFHLNGHAHKIQHGDWFGGKGVGLCCLEFSGYKINLYVTHIHAEYNRAFDEYLPHRLAQAFELSQFIRHTSASCDFILVAGDFNLESSDVGYHMIVTNTPLSDAWKDKKNTPETNITGATHECPFNPFRDKSLAVVCPDGKRIDYIMYRVIKPGVGVCVEKCTTTLGMVPGMSFSYSDHEAVAAEFSIFSREEGVKENRKDDDHTLYLQAARDLIKSGVEQVRSSATRLQLRALGLAVLLFWLSNTDFASSNPPAVIVFVGFLKLGLAVVLVAMVWLSLVVKEGEVHGLLATLSDLDLVLAQDKTRKKVT